MNAGTHTFFSARGVQHHHNGGGHSGAVAVAWAAAPPLPQMTLVARGKRTAGAAAPATAAAVKTRKTKVRVVASASAVESSVTAAAEDELDVANYTWVLLGCDSDAGGALAVARGPHVGVGPGRYCPPRHRLEAMARGGRGHASHQR